MRASYLAEFTPALPLFEFLLLGPWGIQTGVLPASSALSPTRRGPVLRTREAGTAGSASQVKKRGGVGTPRQVNNLRLLGIWLEKSRGGAAEGPPGGSALCVE